MRRAAHAAILLVGITACSGASLGPDAGDVFPIEPGEADVPLNDDAIVDLGVEAPEAGGPCDSSPIMMEDGTWIMYGCEFLHHCYKITLNGEEMTEDLELCGSCGTCIYRLTHVCEQWYLLDDGEISLIVDGETGIIYTHGRMHTGVGDDYPEALELPLTTVPH